MIDREKVIKGLTACTTWDNQGYPNCEECPYADSNGTCPDLYQMQVDALALLKEHEPKILTLDEVKAAQEKGITEGCYWYEGRFGGMAPVFVDIVFQGEIRLRSPWLFNDHNVGSDTMEAWCGLSIYGSIWRLWTHKPTQEQMEAVPWTE